MARWLLLALLAVSLAGCATAPTSRPDTPAESQARALDAQGRHAEAAQAWRSIAATARGADVAMARLNAAEALRRAGDAAGARAELAEAPRRRLVPGDQFRHDLLTAGFALDDGRGAEALALLQQDRAAVPGGRVADWLALRARALDATGDRFGMAAALAERAGLLQGAERAAELRNAERQLKSVPDAALVQQAGFLGEDAAILPLALREARRRGLEVARTAAAPAPADRPPPASDGYHPPRRMAVLLPLSGELAPAGLAVRDGLLAAYYAESRARPSVAFHDTKGTVDGAKAARDRAVAEGADLLVGPLGREEVAALAAAPIDSAAWLALNRTPVATAGGGSFALAPEDEGAAVAQRLIERGLTRAVAIAEGDDSAQRALAGFRERFVADGGELLAVAPIDAFGGNAAEGLATLATHATRAQALFVAARAPALRILMPQREEAGLVALPVLATSLVQSGGDPRLDRELDGLQYPELPWLLGDLVGPGDAESLGRRLPSARGSAARLFAFGFDAWKVATYLDALRGGAQLRGATGELGIDAAGIVERVPAWAEYSGGVTRRASDGALVPVDATPPPTP
ncbi:penicillin-binding protein activator [Silanimonas algicola]